MISSSSPLAFLGVYKSLGARDEERTIETLLGIFYGGASQTQTEY